MKTLFFLSLLATLTFKGIAQEMIPTTGSVYTSKNRGLGKAGGTLVFCGVNVALDTFNALNIGNKKKNSNAGFGIITGVAQIANGVIYNEKEAGLKTVDISMGTATALFSTFCLMKTKKTDEALSFSPSFLREPFIGKVSGFSLRLKF